MAGAGRGGWVREGKGVLEGGKGGRERKNERALFNLLCTKCISS